jgi:hypothetical protein
MSAAVLAKVELSLAPFPIAMPPLVSEMAADKEKAVNT